MVQYEFNDKVEEQINKSVKATLRFYNELRKASATRGEAPSPPSFETFSQMASGLEVLLDKLRTPTMKGVLEQTWAQKLQNYSTKRLLRDSYERLLKKF